MPKCPECGEEIEYLLNYATVQYIFEVNEDGEPEYIHNDVAEEGTYHCPVCLKPLFTTEKEAIEFLKPKTIQTTLT